ncbi:GNAT family N-acetyltransferase [Actinoallomurus sp. NPDC052274]|uniref:GNAT family N-acetyltransferase n=1 Tax=Actinoallomurus sp. NPDC052274 TaxID=3155420 RepID=UPI00343AD8AF
MGSSSRVEFVEASFDDPIMIDLYGGRTAEPAARSDGTTDRHSPAEPGTTFLVARDRTTLIGCVGLRWVNGAGGHEGGPSSADQIAEVGHVYVRPDFRRFGVSRLLLRAAEDLARRRGCRTARLVAIDPRDAGLCEFSGYVPIQSFGPQPVRSVCFEKRLRAETGR